MKIDTELEIRSGDEALTDQTAAGGCCEATVAADGDGARCAPSRGPRTLSRRQFTQLLAAGAGALTFGRMQAIAEAAGVSVEDLVLVPADKGLSKEWIRSLYERGAGSVLQADELRYVGMPVGGITCGQVYLGGDGRIWLWDIDNRGLATGDAHYAHPVDPARPFDQGFVLRTRDGGRTQTRFLDSRGFGDISFAGRYPVGNVDYRDSSLPVSVQLAAYSPFIPLQTGDSSIPAVVAEYTIENRTDRTVQAEIAGYAEHPVVLASRMMRSVELSARTFGGSDQPGVEFLARDAEDTSPGGRPDIVVEDWESGTYDGWTAEGEAFGSRPLNRSELPAYSGAINLEGDWFVFSHDPRNTLDPGQRDNLEGKLTSDPFTLERKALSVRIGGGARAGATCLNVVVDGSVVATATGAGGNTMVERTLDLTAWEGKSAVIEIVDSAQGSYAYVSVDQIVQTDLIDVVFDDFEKSTYEGWTVEGTAFGSGPVRISDIPSYQGNVGGIGTRVVNSHASAPGTDVGVKDGATGKLTSDPFTIDHPYITFLLGGGNHPGETCLNVVVDGTVVATATGNDANLMTPRTLNVSRWKGKQARIEIVDATSAGWGNIGVDQIVFSHRSGDTRAFSDLPDGGTFSISLLSTGHRHHKHGRAFARPSVATWSSPDAVLDSAAGPETVDGVSQTMAGAVGTELTLRPHEKQTVRFLLTWHFPVPDRASLGFLQRSNALLRHYATRFDSAQAVAEHVFREQVRLAAGTRLWEKTWYEDSTLPWWLLERVGSSAATLATSTCYRFDDGRFYGWEGVYCCAGTCEHVWQYAHTLARLFPDLERDTRERVDLGIGFHPDTGEIGNRAEADQGWATDGECGTLLRIYREHQMSADGAWLQNVWPRVKLALQFVMSHDTGADGLLDGGQPNTLDATWFGHISWLSGLYVAALRAGEAMATEVGDDAFAAQCRSVAEAGSDRLATDLWSGEYFIHELDPAHTDTVNTNRGCFIDQVLGQSWALQVGLPRIVPADKARTALKSLWRYNFAPKPFDYRDHSPIPGGRIYYDQDTPALLMCTWPHGGGEEAGANWSIGYFNEAMNGFEYQAAGHMIGEGLVEHGLAVTRAVHDRYQPARRNPYNEVECGDHYARSMASYGVYLNVLGYEHHGPKGHLGFDPRIQQDDIAAAFTTAEGWGLFSQRRHGHGHQQTNELELRHGRLTVRTLSLGVTRAPRKVKVRAGHHEVPARHTTGDGRVVITFDTPVVLEAGESLTAMCTG